MFVLLLCSGVSLYFMLHAAKGNYGLEARSGLVVKAERLTRELERLHVVRDGLVADVKRLQTSNLDLDYLDERARAVLNLAHPDDVVFRR